MSPNSTSAPRLDDCVELLPASGLQWLRASTSRQHVDALNVPDLIEGVVFDEWRGVRWVHTEEPAGERQYFAVVDTHHEALADVHTGFWLRPHCRRARIMLWLVLSLWLSLSAGCAVAGVLWLPWTTAAIGALVTAAAHALWAWYLSRYLLLGVHVAVQMANVDERAESAVVSLDPGYHSNNLLVTVAGHERPLLKLAWTWTEGGSIHRRVRDEGPPFRSSLYWSDRNDECGLGRGKPTIESEEFTPAPARGPRSSLFCFVAASEIDTFSQTAHDRVGEFRYAPKSSAYVVGGAVDLQHIEDCWVVRMFKAMLQGAIQSANMPRRSRDLHLGERPFVRIHRVTFGYPANISMELRTRYRNALGQAMGSLGVQCPNDLIATTMSEASAVACSLLVRGIVAADESRSSAVLSRLLPDERGGRGRHSGRIVIADFGAGTLDIAVTDATYTSVHGESKRLDLRTLYAVTHTAAGDRLTAVFAAANKVDPSNRLRSWVSAEVDSKHRLFEKIGSRTDALAQLESLSDLIDSDDNYVNNGFAAGLELLADVVKCHAPHLLVFSGKSGQIASLYRYLLATLHRRQVPANVAMLRATDLVRMLEGTGNMPPELELLLGKRMVAEGLARALGGFGGIDVVADANSVQLPRYMGRLDPVEGRFRLQRPLRNIGDSTAGKRYRLEVNGQAVFGYRLIDDPTALAVPICTISVSPPTAAVTIELEVRTVDEVRVVSGSSKNPSVRVRLARFLRMPQDFQVFTRGDRLEVGQRTIRQAVELMNSIDQAPKGDVA
jgi:hypothetical protein